MNVEDFEGLVSISTVEELDDRLQSVRRGDYGAFILWHCKGGPSLCVNVFDEIAYLHYFPVGDDHPGYHAVGMQSLNCDDVVKFLQVGGCEADSFFMGKETLVSLSIAYRAAREFLMDDGLPPSVSWLEL